MTSTCTTTNREPTLWSTYHEIKSVLEAPVIEKRHTNIKYDDSKRVVDMTEITPNLFIGDELVYINKLTFIIKHLNIFDQMFNSRFQQLWNKSKRVQFSNCQSLSKNLCLKTMPYCNQFFMIVYNSQ